MNSYIHALFKPWTALVTCTMILSMCANRLARSVNQAAKLQVEGGAESPLSRPHKAGILSWYRSSAASSSSWSTRSPHKPWSVAAFRDCD